MPDLSIQLEAPNGVKYTQPTGLFINNEFVKSSTGETIESIDPAYAHTPHPRRRQQHKRTLLTDTNRSTEQKIASVQAASEEDVDRAVKAAHAALRHESWKGISATDRGALMYKFADLIEQNKEVLATIDAWDNGMHPHSALQTSSACPGMLTSKPGKTYADALGGDLSECVMVMRYYAGWADKTFGQTINTTPQKFAYTIRQPIGVVAQVIPWNYPLAMATWKLGPALACGNTVVLKAAEQTPLSILYLGNLIKEAGFPPGVVNFVNGLGRVAGSALVGHPLVDKVAFTGSTATARAIMGQAAKTLKNITLETGGKSPLLVFDDADIEQAVKWSHMGIMSNQGQICTATSRIVVQESIYDDFIKRFVETLKAVSKVGSQWDKDTYQGPQVSKVQYERVLEYIDIGKKEGANVAAGGEPLKIGDKGKGFFVAPTVFTNVTTKMRVWGEEIFGPVVVIASFKDEEDAIRLANSTDYGLGAAVFTQNVERSHRVAAEIEAGMVWVNSTQDSDPRVPFGGVKQSGIGRELGEAGLEAYSQIKAVHINMGTRL
ncbi:aldehyde dehydrogenase C922.07c-like protein 1 [Colletotrichum sojae]|uniref:Aldehyde dehydrogenase C922.07c-like protein 1 n=1 Tax=Colletotrichum sojae TaxID=2175907 RepID=A0A8H6IVV4_9PEZI|nr:aldehyde dehydrogenase C922.07c-like protein 1 [Colletotrichum sojae]